jgi:hypothetical protein
LQGTALWGFNQRSKDNASAIMTTRNR